MNNAKTIFYLTVAIAVMVAYMAYDVYSKKKQTATAAFNGRK